MTTQLPESQHNCWCLGFCGKTSTSKWITCGLLTWVRHTDTYTNETCWGTPIGCLNISENSRNEKHTSCCTPLGFIDIATTPQYKQVEIRTLCYNATIVTLKEHKEVQTGQAKEDIQSHV
jgi:hypothetical protein